MIGFVTTQEQATAANAAIAEAQTSRGMPVFWLAGSYPIHSGEHAGSYFVPCDDRFFPPHLSATLRRPRKNFPSSPRSSNQWVDLMRESTSLLPTLPYLPSYE
jgi:hypothetical protein